MNLTGFQAYKLYNALKLHFTTPSYDFFKYGGKTKVTKSAYKNRKDRFFFERVAKKYSSTDLRDYFIANFLADRKWVGDFDEDVYLNQKKVLQSLEYVFKREIDFLFKDTEPKQVFRNVDNEYCKLLSSFMRGTISFETMVVLNKLVGYVDKFDEKLKDDFIWEQYKTKIVKYSPFLKFEFHKFKSILLEKMLEKA